MSRLLRSALSILALALEGCGWLPTDETAPEVTAAVPVPPSAAVSPLTVVIVATDGQSGVKEIHARVKPANNPVAMMVEGVLDPTRKVWELALPIEEGPNSVLVWAVDAVGNSGEKLAAPYALAFSVSGGLAPKVSSPVPLPNTTSQSPFPLVVTAEGGQADGVKAVHARVKPLKSPVATTVDGTYDAARGVWQLAIPLENNANSVLVWAVDGAGNSGEQLEAPYSLRFDIEASTIPPMVACNPGPPAYTNADSARLALAVVETGNGIASVTCAVGSSVVVAAVKSLGLWFCTLPLTVGANSIAAWATDSQGRSGRGRKAPYEVTALVTRVKTKPVVSVAYYEAYRPEGGATLRSAKVPPDVDYHGVTKVTIRNGSTISKLLQNLSWGPTPPTVDELEGPNSRNVPFIAFEVASAAPITSATCAITFPGFWPGSGPPAPPPVPLMRSNRVVAGKAIYLLPLSRETVFLSYTSSARFAGYAQDHALTLALAPAFVDAAGNSGALSISVDLQMLGAPLHVAEDTQYPATSTGDSLSVYHYRLSDGSYENLSADALKTAGTMPPELRSAGALRLIRYVVSNPWPEPLSLEARAIPAPYTSCNSEQHSAWDLWEASTYVPVPWAKGYGGLAPSERWRYLNQGNCTPPGPMGAECPPPAPGGCMETDADKGSNDNRLYPRLDLDGNWSCISTAEADASIHAVPAAPIASWNATSFVARRIDTDAPAPRGVGGEILVPSASADGPGQLALYLTRDVADYTMRGVPARLRPDSTVYTPYWPLAPSPAGDPIKSMLAAPVFDYWRIAAWVPCHYGFLAFYSATHCIGEYQGHRLIRQLTAASEHICASVTIGSRAYDAQIGSVGQSWIHPDYQERALARIIAH